MMKNWIFLGVILLFLAGCSTKPSAASVTGTFTYLQRIALPEDSQVSIAIEDISLADAPAQIINEIRFTTNGAQVPIPFEIEYDPAVIQENHSYNLRVRIERPDGSLMFISDTVTPIITMGSPVEGIEVVLAMVSNTN